MRDIERLAEEFLARIPSYVWDGATLPVPIEEIADTHVGLLERDVDDLGIAPGVPELAHGQALSGLLLPAVGERRRARRVLPLGIDRVRSTSRQGAPANSRG